MQNESRSPAKCYNEPEPNFESMSFSPFSSNNNFSDSNQDLNVTFFLGNIPYQYSLPKAFHRKKQKLYEKYLKNHIPQNLAMYKTYKNIFEAIKKTKQKLLLTKDP